MKFEKFVKSLATSGVIYEQGILKDRWLASPSVFMLIPVGVRSVTAAAIQPMPDAIEQMVEQIGHTEYAELVKAVMPVPDGGIKDCVRIFATKDGSMKIPISNDDWSLIEKSDFCEILYTYDIEEETTEVKALLVKRYPEFPDDDDQLVGIIFPCNYEEQLNFYTMKEENKNG